MNVAFQRGSLVGLLDRLAIQEMQYLILIFSIKYGKKSRRLSFATTGRTEVGSRGEKPDQSGM
jgi:hypothetical protein